MPLVAFPVVGPHQYIDSWHYPRPGGRVHLGADIMSPRGTPVVAVDDGHITDASNALGGRSLNLKSRRDMARYYYAHLDSFEGPVPRNVEAGEVIGYVGATGNAAGGAPHLHFEVHPLGGDAVDPYPYLKAAEDGAVYAPPASSSRSPWIWAAGIVGLAVVGAVLLRRGV